jgi:methylamine utilization protein MauE
MRYFILGCAVALLVIFGVSAVTKLRNRSAYAAFVRSSRQLLPPGSRLVTQAAVVVVSAEVATVVLLPVLPVAGFAVAAVLLATFSVAILAAVRRGVSAPCRCFGASSRPLGRSQAVRNATLTALALVGGAGAVTQSVATGPELVADLHPGGVAVAVLAAAVVALCTIFFDDFADLFTSGSVPAGRDRPTERT